MAAVMALAAKLCKEDEHEEEKQHGELLPCRKLSPLSPYLKLEEYHMLERDKGKYLLYMAAINQAVSDIVDRGETSEWRNELLVKCLVLGPGLGRLVKFCIDAARHQGTSVMVHAMEANPVAVEFLKKEFADMLGKEVFIHDPFVFHPSVTRDALPEGIKTHCKTFDIVVSELLGCFGDDEFLPELTSSLAKMFLRPNLGIMIPQSWTNYIVPISSHMTHDFLRILKRPSDAGYVMGLPGDCVFLSNATAVWSGNCCQLADKYSADIEFDISLSSTQLQNSKAKEDCNTCCHKYKGVCVSSDGSNETNINGDTNERSSVETKDISCCKAQYSGQSFAQFTCNVKNQNNAQDTPTSTQGSQTSTQDQQIPPQNMASLGRTDTYSEQTPSLDYQRPFQVGNQPHLATLQILLSERATDNYGEGKTADPVTFDYKSKADSCECFCHIQSTHKQKSDMSGVKDSEVFVHGFMGYFTAILYGDIVIDTRHTSLGRNSFHWQCFFFPLREPIKVSALPSDPTLMTPSIKLHLERKCKHLSGLDESLKLWYEWQAMVLDCVCNVCVSSRGSRMQAVPLGGCDKTSKDSKLVNDGEILMALNNPCSSKFSTATQSSVERTQHKYPLQNAEGNCDAVFLQCHKPSKTHCSNTKDNDCLSFQSKAKKQKKDESNTMSSVDAV